MNPGHLAMKLNVGLRGRGYAQGGMPGLGQRGLWMQSGRWALLILDLIGGSAP
jgi:hypothetical protein